MYFSNVVNLKTPNTVPNKEWQGKQGGRTVITKKIQVGNLAVWWGYCDSLLETVREAPTILCSGASSWAQPMSQQKQFVIFWCCFQDGDWWPHSLPCPRRPHPHSSPYIHFSIFLSFRSNFFSDGPMKNVIYLGPVIIWPTPGTLPAITRRLG